MKKYLFSLLVVTTCLAACKKENNTPTTPVMDMVDTTASVKVTGNFVNGPYGTVSGKAKLLMKDGKFTLVLDSVNISNGPDLHVYLSKEIMPVNFIDLGKLKSVTGTQVYEIAGMPEVSQYKFALVHCQLYNHLFGSAPLF
ncbi:MAG: DM13 domain-containing protein [Ferruginibacter sp.]|nr:DM13 domain-containing protein [Ferruginibacter sp.]